MIKKNINKQLSDPLGEYREFLIKLRNQEIGLVNDYLYIPINLIDLTANLITSLITGENCLYEASNDSEYNSKNNSDNEEVEKGDKEENIENGDLKKKKKECNKKKKDNKNKEKITNMNKKEKNIKMKSSSSSSLTSNIPNEDNPDENNSNNFIHDNKENNINKANYQCQNNININTNNKLNCLNNNINQNNSINNENNNINNINENNKNENNNNNNFNRGNIEITGSSNINKRTTKKKKRKKRKNNENKSLNNSYSSNEIEITSTREHSLNSSSSDVLSNISQMKFKKIQPKSSNKGTLKSLNVNFEEYCKMEREEAFQFIRRIIKRTQLSLTSFIVALFFIYSYKHMTQTERRYREHKASKLLTAWGVKEKKKKRTLSSHKRNTSYTPSSLSSYESLTIINTDNDKHSREGTDINIRINHSTTTNTDYNKNNSVITNTHNNNDENNKDNTIAPSFQNKIDNHSDLENENNYFNAKQKTDLNSNIQQLNNNLCNKNQQNEILKKEKNGNNNINIYEKKLGKNENDKENDRNRINNKENIYSPLPYINFINNKHQKDQHQNEELINNINSNSSTENNLTLVGK